MPLPDTIFVRLRKRNLRSRLHILHNFNLQLTEYLFLQPDGKVFEEPGLVFKTAVRLSDLRCFSVWLVFYL